MVAKGSTVVGFTQRYYEKAEYLTLDNWIEQPLAAILPPELKDLGFVLSILHSLAKIIETLHLQNVCIVDLKPANVLVNRTDGTTRVIDSDSFCILDDSSDIVFPAKEVTVGYFEPDSLNAGRAISELSYSQDDYAFGVIAFQLLNFGLHPYQGIWQRELSDYNLESLSKEGVFPYSRPGSTEVLPLPVSVHETFPDPIRTLFDRTFSKGLPRVTIRNWLNVLEAISSAQLLEICSSQNLGTHTKFRDYPCGQCKHERLLSPPRPPKSNPSKSNFPNIPPQRRPQLAQKSNRRRAEAAWGFGLLLAIPIIAWIFVARQEQQPHDPSANPQVQTQSQDQSQTGNPTTQLDTKKILIEGMSVKELCHKALNSPATDWDGTDSYAEFVSEAHRRSLTVSNCRVAIGLGPSIVEAVPPATSTDVRALTPGQLCWKALKSDASGWDPNEMFKEFVAEARRRTLSVSDCRLAIGADSVGGTNANNDSEIESTSPKSYVMHVNRDIVGSDLSSGPASNSDICQSRCESTTSCVGYVFDRWNGYCVLKSTAQSLRGEPKADSYLLQGTTAEDQKSEWKVDQYPDRRFLLPAYKRETYSNSDDCIRACMQDSKCWGISFTTFTRQCDLHDSLTKAFVKTPGSVVGVLRQ